MNSDGRLYTLDFMRGMAAILVVLYHLSEVAFRVVPGGYLAVDFFFALSGFVLAQAYQDPLQHGLTVSGFMVKRIIRLYPMFILGVGFAIIKAFGQIVADDGNAMSMSEVGQASLTEVAMLPSPVTGEDLFPLNGPAWSLFFELIINLIFAALLVSLRNFWLWLILAVAAVGVCAAAMDARTLNVGWSWDTAWGGMARVTFSFCVGMLIFRHGVVPRWRSSFVFVPILVLLAALILPVDVAWRPIYDSFVALLVAPTLLVMGATLQPPKALNGTCEILGDISFPIYAIHFPLLFMMAFAARKIGVLPELWVPAFIIGLMAFAWFLGRYVDAPLRHLLTSALVPRRTTS